MIKSKREKLQRYTAIGLPVVIIGGWIYPLLGFSLLLCMAGAVGLAFWRGRAWCDWMCPRGSFYDSFISKFSRKAKIPEFFRTKAFRIFILTALVAALGAQIYHAWGNADKVGLAFIRVLTITTTAGIVLGGVFQQRAWCHICPMGTLANWVSKGKEPLYVSDECRSCKLCAKTCPMQLKPYEYKSDIMGDADCIKCSTCVEVCPKDALEFKKAA